MSDIKMDVTVNSVIDNLGDTGLPEGDPEISIFTTDGILTAGDGMTLTFTEESDGQSATSRLKITDGGVHLTKSGAINSDMRFAEGESFDTLYKVGPYAFDMTVKTKRIRCDLTENGGTLQLIYSMNIGGQEKNVRMKISAKRK